MKIMFISDIHGSVDSLTRIKEIYYIEKPNELIILGDVYLGGFNSIDELNDILESINNKIVIRGNCDSEVDVLTSPLMFIDYYYDTLFGKKFFCTHGHIYNISRFPNKDFDVMVSGHTHRGMILKDNGKYFLNPGSISRPRGDSNKSFMIIDDNGIYLKDLDNNIIDKLNW